MWRLTRPDAAAALDDPRVVKSLPRYVSIVQGKRLAKFVIDKAMHVEFDPGDQTEELWRAHASALRRYPEMEREVDEGRRSIGGLGSEPSFLDLKAEIGRRIMKDCHFCVRGCGVDRLSGRERGYCRCGVEFALSSYFPHLGEEPELVPSGTVFTCGCSMRCIHCQNWEISQSLETGTTGPSTMADVVESLKRRGVRNLNMVGGDPTPYCWQWLQTMREVDTNIATVWNSNSYYSQETAELLAGFIDLYLLDFKYGNDKHAEEISDAPGYWEAATRSHLMAKKHGELIIRVLVLPEHNECCTRPILEWIAENLGLDTRVNLMFQYRPEWRAGERQELGRRLTPEERKEALSMAREAGLTNLVGE